MTETESHLWAVYAEDGTMLTTLAKAGEGEYWAYKAGLANTVVGPYPDRDRPMLQLLEPCPRCDGTGKDRWRTHAMKVDADLNPIIPEEFTVDPSRDHEIVTCFGCNGLLFTKKGGGGSFRSPQTLKAARTKGTAMPCKTCTQQTGKVVHMPIITDCYHCKGAGMKPTWDPSRPILPPTVSDCDDATAEFMRAWLETITITVNRSGRNMTWGESHLGLMGLGSCTDYGRRWQANDDTDLIFDVVEDLMQGGTQFIKLITRETRVFGHALVIDVTPQGYTTLVVGADLTRGLASLPPTYFPRVFQEA